MHSLTSPTPRSHGRHAVKFPAIPWELALDTPISTQAERAWQVTRGSDEVAVAIIDSRFDLARLPIWVQIEVQSAALRPTAQIPQDTDHGTFVAELLCGSVRGYPGVAPHCRYLLIELPTCCSEAEEVRAFDLALASNAAVVCCAWGRTDNQNDEASPLTPAVAQAISRVASDSRQGRGALILFAAHNGGAAKSADVYLRHPAAIGVRGVTGCGETFPSMTGRDSFMLAAPVSDLHRRIGGASGVPPGNSGAVALAAGTAALTFAANPLLSAHQVLGILRRTATVDTEFRNRTADRVHPLLNAAAAVTLARSALPERPHRIAHQHWPAATASHEWNLLHEKRFIGGEHSYLGHLGCRTVQKIYQAQSNDVHKALFEGELGVYTSSTTGGVFDPSVLSVIGDFFGYPNTPSFQVPTFNNGIPFAYLVGLAADLFNSPVDLGECVFREHSYLAKLLWEFNDEIEKRFKNVNDDILLTVLPTFEDRALKYLDLAKKNYSHFAGDNLLFYISHHLLAISAAVRCAAATNEGVALASFREALLSEAFADHFLTDMFSAGHARVPRWAWMHGGIVDKGTSDILAKLMHDHEGRTGVFLTNISGQLWEAKGDGGLLDASSVCDSAIADLPYVDQRSALGIAALLGDTPGVPLHPKHLAASLVCASLVDVLRHTASGVPASASAVGGTGAPRGLLGYILDHVPVALPPIIKPELASAIAARFGKDYSSTTLGSRIRDGNQLFVTYDRINWALKKKTYHLYSDISEFEPFRNEYLSADAVKRATNLQIGHLLSNLTPSGGQTPLLYDVPMLVGGIWGFESTLTDQYVPEAAVVPEEWKVAIPARLLETLTSGANGVWGLGS